MPPITEDQFIETFLKMLSDQELPYVREESLTWLRAMLVFAAKCGKIFWFPEDLPSLVWAWELHFMCGVKMELIFYDE